MKFAIMYRTKNGVGGIWRNKFFTSRKAAKAYLLQHEEDTIASWRHVWIEAFHDVMVQSTGGEVVA